LLIDGDGIWVEIGLSSCEFLVLLGRLFRGLEVLLLEFCNVSTSLSISDGDSAYEVRTYPSSRLLISDPWPTPF
jgi:hypothetical protein